MNHQASTLLVEKKAIQPKVITPIISKDKTNIMLGMHNTKLDSAESAEHRTGKRLHPIHGSSGAVSQGLDA